MKKKQKELSPFIVGVIAICSMFVIGFFLELVGNDVFAARCKDQDGFLTVQDHDLTCIKK